MQTASQPARQACVVPTIAVARRRRHRGQRGRPWPPSVVASPDVRRHDAASAEHFADRGARHLPPSTVALAVDINAFGTPASLGRRSSSSDAFNGDDGAQLADFRHDCGVLDRAFSSTCGHRRHVPRCPPTEQTRTCPRVRTMPFRFTFSVPDAERQRARWNDDVDQHGVAAK